MTAVEKTKAISDLLAAGLPSLLATASLDNFDEYLNKSPLRIDDKELCVYIDFDDNTTDNKDFGVIIQTQLNGEDQVQEYHSVIMPFIESNLKGSTIGMVERVSIKSNVWPIDKHGTSYIYYEIEFTDMLDKCD